jgi:uncharacterized membrane protein YtjA (UPF0391 family)
VKGAFVLLGWALFFLLIAVVAGILGFTTIAQGASLIAKILFAIIFILLLALALFAAILL